MYLLAWTSQSSSLLPGAFEAGQVAGEMKLDFSKANIFTHCWKGMWGRNEKQKSIRRRRSRRREGEEEASLAVGKLSP